MSLALVLPRLPQASSILTKPGALRHRHGLTGPWATPSLPPSLFPTDIKVIFQLCLRPATPCSPPCYVPMPQCLLHVEGNSCNPLVWYLRPIPQPILSITSAVTYGFPVVASWAPVGVLLVSHASLARSCGSDFKNACPSCPPSPHPDPPHPPGPNCPAMPFTPASRNPSRI